MGPKRFLMLFYFYFTVWQILKIVWLKYVMEISTIINITGIRRTMLMYLQKMYLINVTKLKYCTSSMSLDCEKIFHTYNMSYPNKCCSFFQMFKAKEYFCVIVWFNNSLVSDTAKVESCHEITTMIEVENNKINTYILSGLKIIILIVFQVEVELTIDDLLDWDFLDKNFHIAFLLNQE